MRSLLLSISPYDFVERDRMIITSDKQKLRFMDRARNDIKEGSPGDLIVIEITGTGEVQTIPIA